MRKFHHSMAEHMVGDGLCGYIMGPLRGLALVPLSDRPRGLF